MIKRNKIVDLAILWDLSIEEVYILDLIYTKNWIALYKYSNYTNVENEVRPNPNNGTDKFIGKRINLENDHGLPAKKNVIVNGNKAIRAINSDMVLDLIERGFIERELKTIGKEFDLTDFRLGEQFEKEFIFDTEYAIEELYDAYPNQGIIDGKKTFWKSYPRDLMYNLYPGIINKDVTLHNEIIEKIKANKNDIHVGIERFVKAQLWESLELQSKHIDMSNDV